MNNRILALLIILIFGLNFKAAALFDFSLPALEKKHPEILLINDITESMKKVKPLPANLGTNKERPALYLNGNWQFLPILGKAPKADTIAKTKLFVPSMLAEGHNICETYAPAEKEWYEAKKMWFSVNVEIPKEFDKSRPIILRFDAVDFLGVVFVHGKHVATHAGRWTPFEVELDPALLKDPVINISVFVLKSNYAIEDDISWFQLGSSYRKGPPGGITAPVCLYQDTPARIQHVRIVTSFKKKDITISCTTEKQVPGISIQPVVLDADGKEVKELNFARKPLAKELSWQASWPNPILWNHVNPYLYRLRFDQYQGNQKIPGASQSEHFGFREIEVKGKQILVNGVPTKLFGVSVGLQTASAFSRSDEDFNYRYFKVLKEKFGINALRFHHALAFGPQIRAADRAGMYVINQGGAWTSARDLNYRGGEDTLKNFDREFSEWMWRDMNSPGTIIWDVANEYIAGSPGLISYWEKFDEIARKIDTSRIIEQSAAGERDGKAEVVHRHTGYGRDSRANRQLPPKVNKPFIFGEFLSPKEMEIPRFIFGEATYNDEYIKTFEDRLAEYRLSGAAGIFPFYSMEDGFIIDKGNIPKNQKFAPESFNPKKINSSHQINVYDNIDKQIDPKFAAMAERVFSPVVGLWDERSHFFEQGKTAKRSLYVANDSLQPIDADIKVELKIGGESNTVFEKHQSMKPGDAIRFPVTVPAMAKTGKGTFDVTIKYGDKTYTNSKPAHVLSCAKVANAPELQLYGCRPETEKLLQGLGYKTKKLTDLVDYKTGTLVVGENAVKDAGKLRTVLDMMKDNIVVLKQDDADFASFLDLDIFHAGDLVHAGVYAPTYDKVLYDRGVTNYDSPGGTDAAYFDCYASSPLDSLIPPNITILFSGHIPNHIPCLSFAHSKGNMVFCQLPLEGHLEDDVRAKKILKRLIEVSGETQTTGEGAIFADTEQLRESFKELGLPVVDQPSKATLLVVNEKKYIDKPEFNGAKNVLIYAGGKQPVDGHDSKLKYRTGFITFIVSPDVPGLNYLTATNFYHVIKGTINKLGGQKFNIAGIEVDNTQRAVIGKVTKPRMRVFEEPGGISVLNYYKKDGDKDRWITAFKPADPFVTAMVISIARSMNMPIKLQTAKKVRDYYIESAGDVKVDGNLEEWTYLAKDQAIHNWRHAMPMVIGDDKTWGIFYAMEDPDNLYLSFITGKDAFASPEDKLNLECGASNIVLKPQPNGLVEIQVNGAPSKGKGVWVPAKDPDLVDAGPRAKELKPAIALEVAIPHSELGLPKKLQSRLSFASHGKTFSYPPVAPDAENKTPYYTMRLKQGRFKGGYPPGGKLVSSSKPETEVFLGKMTFEKVPSDSSDFKDAFRVKISETAGKDWKQQFQIRSDKEIAQGDLLLGIVYARCLGKNGEFETRMTLGQNQDPIIRHNIRVKGEKWQRFYARGYAKKDYAPRKCIISLALGFLKPCEIEFGGLEIINYGKNFDIENVPAGFDSVSQSNVEE